MSKHYAMPDHVYAVASEAGALVLLNRHTNNYHLLDRTRSAILRSIAGTSFEDAFSKLSARYRNVSPEQLRADMKNCLEDALRIGILQEHPNNNRLEHRELPLQPKPPRFINYEDKEARPKVPNNTSLGQRVTAACAFTVVKIILNRIPGAKLPLLKRLQDKWCNREATWDEAQQLLQAAQRVPYLGKIACLEAPFTAALVAATSRRRLDWHLGVSFDPLGFHAWIEVGRKPVTSE
ncbi:MAG: lasso peptide biosynthesis B2 protein, partial [Chloroflexota bacterium]